MIKPSQDNHAQVGIEITPIPAFNDNYQWLLVAHGHAVIVDPCDAATVLVQLAKHDLQLAAILLTHHHADHVGGVDAIIAQHPAAVYGPADPRMPMVTRPCSEGDRVELPALGLSLTVMALPGHTATHLGYYAAGLLFCGDTLFSAGCGRVFDGSPEALYQSLQRLAALPDETAVYCAHEYTLANLGFAHSAEPNNPERDAWQAECERLRAADKPTLPSRIGREKAINPFLRCDHAAVVSSASAYAGRSLNPGAETFAVLRAWKNVF